MFNSSLIKMCFSLVTLLITAGQVMAKKCSCTPGDLLAYTIDSVVDAHGIEEGMVFVLSLSAPLSQEENKNKTLQITIYAETNVKYLRKDSLIYYMMYKDNVIAVQLRDAMGESWYRSAFPEMRNVLDDHFVFKDFKMTKQNVSLDNLLVSVTCSEDGSLSHHSYKGFRIISDCKSHCESQATRSFDEFNTYSRPDYK